jgi:hypothetical protein
LEKKRGTENQAQPIKKPAIFAEVDAKSHGTHKNSGLIIYWISILLLVVLNMLSAIVVAVVQFAVSDKRSIALVAILGLCSGYASNKLVTLADGLQTRHKIFAGIFVPAAAVLILVLITLAANNLAKVSNIGNSHNPALSGITYGIAFLLPSLISAVANIGRTTE